MDYGLIQGLLKLARTEVQMKFWACYVGGGVGELKVAVERFYLIKFPIMNEESNEI